MRHKTTTHKKTAKKASKVEAVVKTRTRLGTFWVKSNIWRRLGIGVLAIIILWVTMMYSVAQWYIAGQADKPLKYGVTFIPSYAEYLGVDPKETMKAMIDELGIRQFRLVSYWTEGERVQGTYDFSTLDWQFKMAEESGSKVSLAIGLRQPRWPECHMPDWAEKMPKEQWSVLLKNYMEKVITRYKDNPVLESYQLENEYFLKVFGICPDHSRDRLVDEYNFVKTLDNTRPLIVSRSNNGVGLPVGKPRPDVSAVSVYKRVWDKTLTHRYFEYPFPAWFYASLAGGGKIVINRDLILHELQAEPWLPEGYKINDLATIDEQNKSMDAARLKTRIDYGRATGMKEIYLWGAEWWYWRKVVANDPSLWDTAKTEIESAGQMR